MSITWYSSFGQLSTTTIVRSIRVAAHHNRLRLYFADLHVGLDGRDDEAGEMPLTNQDSPRNELRLDDGVIVVSVAPRVLVPFSS